MADSPLLLMVQMDCSKEHLEPFTTWYNSHLPNLLRIPGYHWAQRYVNLESGTRFTAIYGIRSAHDLPSLVQLGGPDLHPIAASEYSVFKTLQGIGNPVSNVYEQIGGAPLRYPLLLSDRPLSIVTADVDPAHEEEWDRWYTESHLPGVLAVPGYACGARFRRFDHPALETSTPAPSTWPSTKWTTKRYCPPSSPATASARRPKPSLTAGRPTARSTPATSSGAPTASSPSTSSGPTFNPPLRLQVF